MWGFFSLSNLTWCTFAEMAMIGDRMDPILADAEAVPRAVERRVVGYRSLVKVYPAPKEMEQKKAPIQAHRIMPQWPLGNAVVRNSMMPAIRRLEGEHN